MRATQLVALGLTLTLILGTLAACGRPGSKRVVRVASKDFPEQLVIGEMYALLLEADGFEVVRKLNFGPTAAAHEALRRGQIDLYPEYTGTALLNVLKRPSDSDRARVYATVSREYASQFGLVWLDPAPMNNTQALAMARHEATRLGIRTISDFAEKAGDLSSPGPAEFEDRVDGLPGLQRAYGFAPRQYVSVDITRRYDALVDGSADAVVAFGTDGEIASMNLVVLVDDLSFFPPYQVAPVVRREILDGSPEIAETLNRLAPLLTDDAVRRLNYQVTGRGRPPAAVAREFLVLNGLIRS